MSALQKYLKKDYLQKVLICIFGNLIMGIGIALTKMATLGNDPFNGSCMSVSAALNIPYTTYTLLFNTALFVFELLFGRKYIDFGTLVNWFLVCYVVDFFLPIWEKLVGTPDIFVLRLLILAGGLVVTSFGLAIYQAADAGVSPYDVIPLMVTDRHPKIPFFVARVTLDAICTVSIIVCGGIVSIATLATVFGMGPIVQIFTKLLFPDQKK